VWQIDESKPSVKFNTISKPAFIKRQTAISTSLENLTPTRKLQYEFWFQFRERLIDTKKLPSTQSPRPQYWFDIALGRSGFCLSCIANVSDNKIGVRTYLHSKTADTALERLLEQKSEIESELGFNVEWNPNPENTDKVIACVRDADFQNKAKWDEYLNWMVETALKMREVFMPRVKKLDLG
jgi:Domain of unknown function (DUF4268)